MSRTKLYWGINLLLIYYQEEKIHANTYAGQVPLYQETEDIVVI